MVTSTYTPLSIAQKWWDGLIMPDDEDIEWMPIHVCPENFYEFTFSLHGRNLMLSDCCDPAFIEMTQIARASLEPLFRKKEEYEFSRPVFYMKSDFSSCGVKIGTKRKPPKEDTDGSEVSSP